jgi:hypothetical protein
LSANTELEHFFLRETPTAGERDLANMNAVPVGVDRQSLDERLAFGSLRDNSSEINKVHEDST